MAYLSASNPGRAMARYAIVRPSGENTGPVSQASLASVRFSKVPSPLRPLVRNRSKLVLHGSDRPATRDEKTIDWPSGAKTNSLSSPNGLEGVSPSKPRVTITGAPVPSALTTNRWFCVPSAQVSQWRTNIRS